MHRKLIVGDDGRAQARDALALGSMLAKITGADLAVAGVVSYELPLAVAALRGASVPPMTPPQSLIDRVLEEIRPRAEEAGGSAEAIVASSPAHGLQRLAERHRADLIVVGSCHHGPVGRVLVGSVGERLVHGAPCAVAIAPRGFHDGRGAAVRVVGVGYDGGPEADLALAEAAELAHAADASLRLVAVVATPPVSYAEGVGAVNGSPEAVQRQFLEERVDRALASIRRDVQGDGSVLLESPAKLLAEQDVDLMVVGSRGYGPLRTLLMGGVSLRLVRSAPYPVIVVPRPGTERTGNANP